MVALVAGDRCRSCPASCAPRRRRAARWRTRRSSTSLYTYAWFVTFALAFVHLPCADAAPGQPRMKITVTVNGVAYERDVEPRLLLSDFIRARPRADRHARRLRARRLRRVHGPLRRRAGAVLHHVRRAGRRARRCRPSKGSRRRRRAQPAAAAFHERARPAMRLLHARHADDAHGLPAATRRRRPSPRFATRCPRTSVDAPATSTSSRRSLVACRTPLP